MPGYDVFGQTGSPNFFGSTAKNTGEAYQAYGAGANQYASSLAAQLAAGIPVMNQWGQVTAYPEQYRQAQMAPQISAQQSASQLAAQQQAAQMAQLQAQQSGAQTLAQQQQAGQMEQLKTSIGGQTGLQEALLKSQEQQQQSMLANALEQIGLKTSGESELLGKKASLTNEMITSYWNQIKPYMEGLGVTAGSVAGSVTGQQPLSYNYAPTPGELSGLEETYSQGRRAAMGSSQGRERGRALAEALQSKMLGLTNLQATGRQTAANAAVATRGQNLGLLGNLLSGLKPSITF